MEKNKLKVGMLVKCQKGHDSGKLHLVVAEVSEQFVLIADGERRLIESPKLKRVKHLKAVIINAKPVIMDTQKLTNAKLKRFIKDNL